MTWRTYPRGSPRHYDAVANGIELCIISLLPFMKSDHYDGLDIMLGSTYADFRPQWRQCYVPAHFLSDQHLRLIIEQVVAPAFDVARDELWAQTRGSSTTAFARQVAMYLAHVGCGLTLTEVGRVFARDRTTVAHACSLVEDRREEPHFDRALELLEAVVRLCIPLAWSGR